MAKGSQTKNTALFIMPRSSEDWKGSEALWITVAGWAAAAERQYGRAIIMTTDRTATPREVLDYPLEKGNNSDGRYRKVISIIPNLIITLLKDISLWRSSKRRYNYDYDIPENVSLVWEQHDLFSGPGYKLAKKFNAPFVIYVHAPQVWEASKWGVQRPLWGRLLERLEANSLKRADLVACVSQEVANKLVRMGICSKKIIVSPMAVDPDLFKISSDSLNLRKFFKLEEKLIIGWTGSFRNFHGLDLLVDAFELAYKKNNNLHLVLVGDGIEKEATKRRVNNKKLTKAVSFIGKKSFKQISQYVGFFDIAIVSARKAQGFHYSPLKLREYLCSGKATLAPMAGEIPNVFKDNVHLKLYKAGDVKDMGDKIYNLALDPHKRQILEEKGKEFILKNSTWEVEFNRVLSHLT